MWVPYIFPKGCRNAVVPEILYTQRQHTLGPLRGYTSITDGETYDRFHIRKQTGQMFLALALTTRVDGDSPSQIPRGFSRPG